MAGRITKRAVDGLQPGSDDTWLWDEELKGFGLRCRPGGAKSYILAYRVGTGRQALKRRMVIGKHGSPWTPDTARKEATRLLGEIAAGEDPGAERGETRKAITVSGLADLYLQERGPLKKPLTLKADKARIENHIKPLLGARPVRDLSRADLDRLLREVIAGRAAKPTAKRAAGSVVTGGRGVAAQCVTLVGTMLAFAIERGIRTNNPAHGMKKPPVRKMERFLSEQEITRLGEALAAEEEKTGNPYPAAAIRLLLFTGCRRAEIIGLQWSWIDFERGFAFLPDSKTGRKPVHLNAPALAILAGLPRFDSNPHVVVGRSVGAPLAGIDKIWFRVRKAAGLDGVRLHDLRHSHASVGAASNASLQVIGALLGHRNTSTTERYAHLSNDPVRAASEVIGARIAAAMRGGAGAEVVELRKKG